ERHSRPFWVDQPDANDKLWSLLVSDDHSFVSELRSAIGSEVKTQLVWIETGRRNAVLDQNIRGRGTIRPLEQMERALMPYGWIQLFIPIVFSRAHGRFPVDLESPQRGVGYLRP